MPVHYKREKNIPVMLNKIWRALEKIKRIIRANVHMTRPGQTQFQIKRQEDFYTETRSALPYGFSHHPDKGACLLWHERAEAAQAVGWVTGTSKRKESKYAENLPPQIDTNEVIVYSKVGNKVLLKNDGAVEVMAGDDTTAITINADGTVHINAATSVTLDTPMLQVNGDAQFSGQILTQTGVDLANHGHQVQTNPVNGVGGTQGAITPPPIPTP